MMSKNFVRIGVSAVLLSLAACGGKEPGEDSVAVVDGYEITIAELNQELAESGVQDVQDPAARQAALQAIINRKLLVAMAEENELDRTPDYVLKEQRMRDVLLADAAVQSLAPEASRTNDDDIDAYLQTNLSGGRERTVYAIEGVQFSRPKKPEVMDLLGAANNFEQLVGILRANDIQMQGGQLAWDSANMPTELVRQLNALPDGEPFLIPEGDGVVAGVIREKRRLPLNPQQSRSIAEAAVAQQTVRTRVNNWLEQARHSAEIRYGEGFDPQDAGSGEAPVEERATADQT